jgi:hypothetical protein
MSSFASLSALEFKIEAKMRLSFSRWWSQPRTLTWIWLNCSKWSTSVAMASSAKLTLRMYSEAWICKSMQTP